MTDTFILNGEERPWQDQTVTALLRAQGKEPQKGGIAVALNGVVLPKPDWDGARLKPDDRVEIVTVFKGG